MIFLFSHRNNDRLKRDIVIDKVAELVSQKNEKNKADLKNPQLTILIEVIQSNCCISVVPDFYSLKKYNLMELVAQNNDNKLTKLNELENCETDLKKS